MGFSGIQWELNYQFFILNIPLETMVETDTTMNRPTMPEYPATTSVLSTFPSNTHHAPLKPTPQRNGPLTSTESPMG